MMGLASCESAIDLKPQDKEDLETKFDKASATDLQLFSNFFYENTLTQAMASDNFQYEAQDDCKINQNLSAIIKGGTNRTVPASGGGWSWGVLRRMNTLLEYIDRCPDKAAVKKYKGVTFFFRAFFYFEKVKRFGDVPFVDRQLLPDDPKLYEAQDSREYVMGRMLQDLDSALLYLPAKEKETSAPYRVTKGAVLALRSAACLYEGTFRKYHNIDPNIYKDASRYPTAVENPRAWQDYLQLSAEASEMLMSGKYGSYKLYSTNKPADDYRDLFALNSANTDEVILAVKYDQSLGIVHNGNAHTLVSTQGQPGYTRKFVCSYLMKDGSRFTDIPGWQTMVWADEMKDRDPRLQQSVRGFNYKRINGKDVLPTDLSATKTGYQPIKFVMYQWTGNYDHDRNNCSVNDLPEFRYAEVLLNYAEAKAELGTLTQGDLDKSVNLIRKRVGMPAMNMAAANATPDPYLDGDKNPETGYFNVSGDNKGVILEIRRERAIEMVQEGRRFNDLVRWKCGAMLSQSLMGTYFPGPGSYDFSGDGVPDVILYAYGTKKPAAPNGEKCYQIGKDLILSDNTKGYLNYHSNQDHIKFDEVRDYLFPIPTDEINLTKGALRQNPGWGAASGM